MNLYSVDIRTNVAGNGASIGQTLTFHASAKSMTVALKQAFNKCDKYIDKEYGYLKPFQKCQMTAETAKLLDEKW